MPLFSILEWYVTDGLRDLLLKSNKLLSDIYDRLEHIKIDSYVNVRVVDETGEFPVTCSAVTGLNVFNTQPVVTVKSDGSPFPVVNPMDQPLQITPIDILPVEVKNEIAVQIRDQSHPIIVANTLESPLYTDAKFSGNEPLVVHPQVRDAWSGTWYDQLGFRPASTSYYNNFSLKTGTVAGCAALSMVAQAASNNDPDAAYVISGGIADTGKEIGMTVFPNPQTSGID